MGCGAYPDTEFHVGGGGNEGAMVGATGSSEKGNDVKWGNQM
jgi:hypothetical protein